MGQEMSCDHLGPRDNANFGIESSEDRYGWEEEEDDAEEESDNKSRMQLNRRVSILYKQKSIKGDIEVGGVDSSLKLCSKGCSSL